MRRSTILYPAVLLLVLAIASCAFAQYDEDKPGKVVPKVGFYAPQGDLGDRGDSFWQAVGADYVLKYDAQNRPMTYASFERATGEAERFNGSITSITYNRVRRKDERVKKAFYYGVSGGIYWIDTEFFDLNTFTSVSDSGITLGVSGIVGFDFNENYFAEAKYTLTGKVGQDNFSGFTLMFGVRNLF